MRIRFLFALTLFVTTSFSYASRPSTQGDSYREYRNGWIFVHLEGEPKARGYDYGSLLAPEIDDFIATLKVYLLNTTKKDWQFYRDAAQKLFVAKLEKEYLQELMGIAAGLQAEGYQYDYIDIIAQNAVAELADYYLPSITKNHKHVRRPMMRCSAFIATGKWTKDGGIVMAHNSWNDYIIGLRWKVILDINPTTGHRILMQTAPGFIHSGTDFNVNSAGIVITETTIGNFAGFDTNGTPEFMRARKAAQYSSSLDDFVNIMRKGNNGGYANSWLIGDTNTGEIGKLELGLVNVAFYRSFDGYYDGENYVDDSKMIRDEAGPTLWMSALNWPNNLTNANTVDARRLRWYALMDQYKGIVDDEVAKSFMADQIEQATGKFTPGGFVLMGRMEATNQPEVPGATAPRPFGANEGKVITADLARNMSFWARMGHPDGSTFDWTDFFQKNPAFAWQQPYLQNLVANDWTLFSANMTSN